MSNSGNNNGCTARWNDKTIEIFNDFTVLLHEGAKFQDVRHNLYDRVDLATLYDKYFPEYGRLSTMVI
jgi:hypothetical protein